MNDLLNAFERTKIPIVEIFNSISGEGVSAGNVVTFVRVAGCDLRCTWCDTKYSFNEKGASIEELLPVDILNVLLELGTNEIICTGGEPLEHSKSKRYLPAYLHSKGFKVRIETSGGSSLYNPEELAYFKLNEISRPNYTMDIKCPASKMDTHNIFENIKILDSRDELKFVVANTEDLEYSMNIIERYKIHLSENKITLNFSPVFESMTPQELVEFLKVETEYFQANKLVARLSLQIHKFIWPPHKRGV